MQQPTIQPGRPFPLGVTLGPDGANVAVFSAHAERIELCLLDPAGERETARLPLPEVTDGVFHGFVPGLVPGQLYGFRAFGPWAPERGQRFNPHRLLLDPYARAVTGKFVWAGPNLVDRDDPLAFDPRDSMGLVPKGVMLQPGPPAAGERPGTPWEHTILYEAHVRGLTKLHAELPGALRGTYLGLAQPAVLDHLVRLGVTAVELMPVWAFLDELRLTRLGLRNYWGYNPYSFMAPDPRYAVAEPVDEFRAMVEALHGAGIEVVLDVVLNHTAETDLLGPTLSLRGLDNATYYRLDPADPSRYLDWAGCGNSLNLGHPRVLQLAMDALRHWAGAGRRRLPLRPRPRPRPRPRRRLSARRGAAPGDRPGPGAGRPEADRGALGPRAGRLPAGPVPTAVRDVERPLSATASAGSGAATRACCRSSPGGCSAPPTSTRLPAAALGSASTSSPAMTGSPWPTLSAMPGATTRPMASTIATATTTISAPITASRARPTTRRSGRCAPASG